MSNVFHWQGPSTILDKKNPVKDTSLSPAERTAKLLAFRPGHGHNFTFSSTPSKKIPVAGSRFATV